MVDSIIKNVADSDYAKQFSKNLVANFCAVFHQVRKLQQRLSANNCSLVFKYSVHMPSACPCIWSFQWPIFVTSWILNKINPNQPFLKEKLVPKTIFYFKYHPLFSEILCFVWINCDICPRVNKKLNELSICDSEITDLSLESRDSRY